MADAKARRIVIDSMIERYKDSKIEAVVGLESRGYYFGIPFADAIGVPFIPLRSVSLAASVCFHVSLFVCLCLSSRLPSKSSCKTILQVLTNKQQKHKIGKATGKQEQNFAHLADEY